MSATALVPWEAGGGDRRRPGHRTAAAQSQLLAEEIAVRQHSLSLLKMQLQALEEEVAAKREECEALEHEQIRLLQDMVPLRHPTRESNHELKLKCTALQDENEELREQCRAMAKELAETKVQLTTVQQVMGMQEYSMQAREMLIEVSQHKAEPNPLRGTSVLTPAGTPPNRCLEDALVRQEALLTRLTQTLALKDQEMETLQTRLAVEERRSGRLQQQAEQLQRQVQKAGGSPIAWEAEVESVVDEPPLALEYRRPSPISSRPKPASSASMFEKRSHNTSPSSAGLDNDWRKGGAFLTSAPPKRPFDVGHTTAAGRTSSTRSLAVDGGGGDADLARQRALVAKIQTALAGS